MANLRRRTHSSSSVPPVLPNERITPNMSLEKPPRSGHISYFLFGSCLVVLATLVHLVTKHVTINSVKSPIEQLFPSYDPVVHAQRARDRLAYPCDVKLPTPQELKRYPYSDWPLSRFAAYYNIHKYLRTVWKDTSVRPKVVDFGGSVFLKPFNRSIDITFTKYPDVDIHSTDFPTNSFDAVAADQVLEHVMFPHLAMLEILRILKPGGLALITTVAYNPLHEAPGGFHDYWRFMVDGLRMLSMPFEGGIKICGGWGSAKSVATRALHGMGSPQEIVLHNEGKGEELKNNDDTNPFLVWIVAQK